jgi:hypothetical protein
MRSGSFQFAICSWTGCSKTGVREQSGHPLCHAKLRLRIGSLMRNLGADQFFLLLAVMAHHVLVQNVLEFGHNRIAVQRL